MTVAEHTWMKFEDFRKRHPEIGARTLRRLARDRIIPIAVAGRRLLIRSDALDVLSERQMADATTEAE